MKEKNASEKRKFDGTLPEKLREEWLMMIRNWESNESNLDPYTYTEKGISTFLIPHLHILTLP